MDTIDKLRRYASEQRDLFFTKGAFLTALNKIEEEINEKYVLKFENLHDWHRPLEDNPYVDVQCPTLPPKYEWKCSKCGKVVYKLCLEGKPDDKGCTVISDGYHTFDELYEHRTALFAALCNSNSDKAIKSLKHNDGSMFDNMFIVMLDLNGKQISYHCEIKYWDWFNIREADKAPEWDGHTSKDVIDRIISYNWNKQSIDTSIVDLKYQLAQLFKTYVESHTWIDKEHNRSLTTHEIPYILEFYHSLKDLQVSDELYPKEMLELLKETEKFKMLKIDEND